LDNGGSLTFPAPQFVSGGWDNRGVKRKLASAIVILGLLGSSMASVAPASAIFGLSTCEKVKKQVLDFEKKINNSASFWIKYQGKKIPDRLYPDLVAYQKEDLVSQMVKLEFNHPQCFTRTQNIEISGRQKANWNYLTFLFYSKSGLIEYSSKCFPRKYQITSEWPCVLKGSLKMQQVFSLQSIYTY
jgi:hypothetical protein